MAAAVQKKAAVRGKRAKRSSTGTAKGLAANVDEILLYYDGPQVLTLKDKNSKLWIATALPTDETRNYPVFAVQTSSDLFTRFLRGHVDLRYLFRFQTMRDYRIADLAPIDGDVTLVPVKPEPDWFPDEGFFAPDHGIEEIGAAESSQPKMSIKIDGEWEFPEFAAFSGLMSDSYAFLYALNKADRLDIKSGDDDSVSDIDNNNDDFNVAVEDDGLDMPVGDFPWQRGGSSLSFYRSLHAKMPIADRLNVQSISYNSPGSIDLGGSKEILQKMSTCISALLQNYHQAHSGYSELRLFLQRQKLLGAPASSAKGDMSTQQFVEQHTRRLVGWIGIKNIAEIHSKSDENWVLTAKVIMSFYRRLRGLFRFYAEGRAANPE